MRRTLAIFLLLPALIASSCAQPIPPAAAASEAAAQTQAQTSGFDSAAETNVPTEAESVSAAEDEVFALVDWMIFVEYDGRSYTRGFEEPTMVDESLLGRELGRVRSKPPSPTPIDYTTNVPDLTSFGYPIGTPFYEITGVPIEYEIAVYDSENKEYHLLCTEELLPMNAAIHYNSSGTTSDSIEIVTEYETFFGRGQEEYAAYDEAFFEDNVLAVVYLAEGSGSIQHEVTMVRRKGDWLEIHIQRHVPTVGTCDMAYWTFTTEISRKDWDGAEIVPVIHTVQS